VEGSRALRPTAALALLAGLVPVAAAGCGGDDDARPAADERAGMYRVAFASSFPERQALARPARLVVAVRNTGDRTVPNVAVTVGSFGARIERGDLADAQRPVWIVDRPPAGAGTAYTNTWALGPLTPGRTKRFVWRVTPVQAGTHRLRVRIAAGLTGSAKAVLAGDRAAERDLIVRISSRPARSRVDPETGAVVRDGG
jgi:hypothetical protein